MFEYIIACIMFVFYHLCGGAPQSKLGHHIKTQNRFQIETMAQKCSALTNKQFKPAPSTSYTLLQTTLIHRARHHATNEDHVHRREIIKFQTSGSLAIDWIEQSDGHSLKDSPIVINFSGVSNCCTTSGFGSIIIKSIQDHYKELSNLYVKAVNVIYPGFNGHVIDSTNVPGSCYLSTDTVGIVLRHVSELYPDAPLVLIGWSFGGALVSNWLSRNPEESTKFNIKIVLLYAYGHSIKDTVEAADNTWGGIASSSVLNLWKRTIFDNKNNSKWIEKLETECPTFSIERLRNAKTVVEWDTACLPLYMFESIEDLYEQCDPARFFDNINKDIPIVIINADDDWLCPSERVKTKIGDSMPNVAIIETNGGGHLGWIDNMNISTFIRILLGYEQRNRDHSKWLIEVTLRFVDNFLG